MLNNTQQNELKRIHEKCFKNNSKQAYETTSKNTSPNRQNSRLESLRLEERREIENILKSAEQNDYNNKNYGTMLKDFKELNGK